MLWKPFRPLMRFCLIVWFSVLFLSCTRIEEKEIVRLGVIKALRYSDKGEMGLGMEDSAQAKLHMMEEKVRNAERRAILAERRAYESAESKDSGSESEDLAASEPEAPELKIPLDEAIFLHVNAGNHDAVSDILKQKEVDPNKPDSDGNYLLDIAFSRMDWEMTKILQYWGSKQMSPSILADIVHGENTHILEKLSHIKWEVHDPDGRSPLSLAVIHGDRYMVEALLQHGASPDFADSDGKKPMDHASSEANKGDFPDAAYNYRMIRDLLGAAK